MPQTIHFFYMDASTVILQIKNPTFNARWKKKKKNLLDFVMSAIERNSVLSRIRYVHGH